MSAKPTRTAIGALVRQGTTPDEHAVLASAQVEGTVEANWQQWSPLLQ
ncbi:MAG: hypothetical protein ACHQAQ_20850 [Hyphomicrobiales bacterium]